MVRMEDQRVSKQIFYGELSVEKRSHHRTKPRFKYCLKQSHSNAQLALEDFGTVALGPGCCRRSLKAGESAFEVQRKGTSRKKEISEKWKISNSHRISKLNVFSHVFNVVELPKSNRPQKLQATPHEIRH